LQRLNIARAQMEEESRRVRERLAELGKRVEQFNADIAREEQMVRDNADVLARLEAEEATLRETEAGSEGREAELRDAFERAGADLAEKETALSAVTAQKAEAAAMR